MSVTVLSITACSRPQQFSQVAKGPVQGGPEVIADVPPENPVHRPPLLVFTQYPQGPVSTYENATVAYNVIQGTSPIVSIECKIDGHITPCSITGDALVVNSEEEGKHVVEITVTDANDLQDVGTVTWDAYNRFFKVKGPLEIVGEEDRVDILVVIDNSISMRNKQKNMADRVNNLLDRLNGLNWRIGIVTTDMVHSTLGDGRLLRFPNGSYYITSSLSLAAARDQFGRTVQRPEDGNYLEQGIKATYRAIERAMNPKVTLDQQNKAFFRKESALAVIVISDEDESATLASNTPAGLTALIKKSFGDDKIFKFHSIVVREGDKACLDSYPGVHTEGKIYSELTKMTGGVIGDICAADYGNQLNIIGQDVANTQNTYALNCVPMDINGDGILDVRVKAEGKTPAAPAFIIDGDKIIFSQPPKKGSYSLEYYCPKVP